RPAYPLTVVAALRRTLRVSIGFDERRFEGAVVERMLGHLCALLEGIVRSPEKKLGELSLLSADARRRVLGETNRTASEYPRDASIHSLFEAEADRAPGAVAVEQGGERLTYGELDVLANRLARALAKRGVSAEARVGLYAPRSIDMVVAT